MNRTEQEEEEDDLYEGLEAEKIEPVVVKEEKKKTKETPIKSKEKSNEHSSYYLLKKLALGKTQYVRKDPCVFFAAPNINPNEEIEPSLSEFLLLLNVLHFCNDHTIKNVCDEIGKVKRVVIIEEEQYCKSTGMCLVEFFKIDQSQNYTAFLKEKLKVDVKKISPFIENQIRKDELYNVGGDLSFSTIEQLKKSYLINLRNVSSLNETLQKPLNQNRHALFPWFDTNLKDVLHTYVKYELEKKKKWNKGENFYNSQKNDEYSDTDDEISSHIANYITERNKNIPNKI